ncbi:MAG: D-alanine--D-alanine ligase [Clostridia bacterium]
MNIVVLAGGLSPERDVSLSSGTMAANALCSMGHHAILVDLFFGVDTLPAPISLAFEQSRTLPPRPVPETAPDLDVIRAARKSGFSDRIGNGVLELCRAADITYLALHGDCGENGSLQAFFDLSGIRYTGSPSIGCALAMDKYISKKLLDDAGIQTPFGILLKKGDSFDPAALPLPCVVKPCCGGSSIGITIVRGRNALTAALDDAFRYESEVLIEEYIVGRELSAGVLGDKALPLIEIVPKYGFYDYQHKYQPGWTEEITPARFDAETTTRIQKLAIIAFQALRLSVYARIDFLLTDEGHPYCLEANTLPGMTPTSLLPQEAAAIGVNYPVLCNKIIELSMEKYKD